MRVKKETEVKKRGRKPLNKPIKKKPKKRKKRVSRKKKVVKEPISRKWKFQIYLIGNNQKKEFIKSYLSKEKALKEFYEIHNKSKNEVVFPVRYVNVKVIKDMSYYVLLLKRKEENDTDIVKLRNEYGEFVEHELIKDGDEWVIYDKLPYYIEEKFWVYGYHPKYERKDFMFIYNEMVKPKATSKYDFLRVVIFKNKLLLETYNKLDMVICKNREDCIRLYNQLEEYSKRDKFKYILFDGDGDTTRKSKDEWVDKIIAMTGWENSPSGRKKVLRASTRP